MSHGREIIKLINKHAIARRGWELFRDWVTSMAIAFQSAMSMGAEKMELEEQYEKIRERNGDEAMQDFGKAFGMLTMWLEEYPHDALGHLFMLGEWGATEWGQFFTPPEVSELVARLNGGRDVAENGIAKRGYVRLHEPAAGAGGLIIEFSKLLKEWGV